MKLKYTNKMNYKSFDRQHTIVLFDLKLNLTKPMKNGNLTFVMSRKELLH